MPDINKFDALRKAGYSIPVTCGLCVHRNFPSDFAVWGTCQEIKYEHLKHTGADREVSIVRAGTCPNAVLDHSVAHLLGAHAEFLTAGGNKPWPK